MLKRLRLLHCASCRDLELICKSLGKWQGFHLTITAFREETFVHGNLTLPVCGHISGAAEPRMAPTNSSFHKTDSA